MCPNAGSGDTQTDAWQSIYATPIQARLNVAAPGANLTLDDVSSLISLCPFETVAKEKPSPFCSLFSQSDFNGYEYFGDLNKFYGTGYECSAIFLRIRHLNENEYESTQIWAGAWACTRRWIRQ